MDAQHCGACAPGLAVPDLAAHHADPASLGADGSAAARLTDIRTCEGPGYHPEALTNQQTSDKPDCAANAVARAAQLGIEVRPLPAGAWHLRHARGASIGTVQGLGALTAAVAGFEAAANDVRELVQRLRSRGQA